MSAYDLTLAAEEDLREIWAYSLETWGIDQADLYLTQIETCCNELASKTLITSSDPRLPSDVNYFRYKHHIIFWIELDRPIIIGVLHQRMDLVARLRDRL